MTTIPNLNPIPAVTGDDYLITHDITTNRSGRVSALSLKDYVAGQIAADGDIEAANVPYGSTNVGARLDKTPLVVQFYADLSSLTPQLGEVVYLVNHTSAGYGGGHFKTISAAGQSNDGGITLVLGGVALKRMVTTPSPEHFGCSPVANSTTAFQSFLTYIKNNPSVAEFTCDVTITSDITFDFNNTVVNLDFKGFKIIKDGTIDLQNLGDSSRISNPNFYNATTPYVITRWDSNGEWVDTGTALASLTQTNALGYYQPTVNDGDIYGSLPGYVQSQNIFSKLKITSSNNVLVTSPKGRHCLYEFYDCNDITVDKPAIMSGGKGTYGTIVFYNAIGTAYGLRNKVIGGYIGYGSYSAVTFLRNKFGGVTGGFIPFRCGESGVKTYQGNVGGTSSRCYNMEFGDIYPYQAVFDGVDLSSDYGTPEERINDYTIAQFPWNQLPTSHTVYNVKTTKCRGLGIWGDGQFNSYTNLKAVEGEISGIHLICINSSIIEPKAHNNNLTNTVSGTHQLLLGGTGNRIVEPYVQCDSRITAGTALYTTSGNDVVGGTYITTNPLGTLIPSSGTLMGDEVLLGSYDVTQNVVDINFQPRKGILTHRIGKITGRVEVGTPGAEQGSIAITGVESGADSVGGLIARSQGGGFGGIGVATAGNPGWLINREIMFYQNGTNLVLLWKKADGSSASVNLI